MKRKNKYKEIDMATGIFLDRLRRRREENKKIKEYVSYFIGVVLLTFVSSMLGISVFWASQIYNQNLTLALFQGTGISAVLAIYFAMRFGRNKE